ncbi:DUF5686 family protein [Petrimonas sp.]|uniref:DUF5686 family protein n=1 Tax=Petrimonas sp. TaxID=2023866 RepID=UPI003F519E94
MAHTPYYRYQIKEYTSEAYIKGSLTIDKIPGIFKRAMKVNDSSLDFNSLIGKPLVMELKSDIRFTSPEAYQQNMNYQPDHIINKIKVTPWKKNSNLFSGYIYILEDTWNVYIADLVASELGTTMHYLINYHQVQPSVYLPTTYDVTLTINTMGVKGSGNYYASMKYNSVRVDKAGPENKSVKQQEISSAQEKISLRQQTISDEWDKLAQKEELSTKEAYKMSKLMPLYIRTIQPLILYWDFLTPPATGTG